MEERLDGQLAVKIELLIARLMELTESERLVWETGNGDELSASLPDALFEISTEHNLFKVYGTTGQILETVRGGSLDNPAKLQDLYNLAARSTVLRRGASIDRVLESLDRVGT